MALRGGLWVFLCVAVVVWNGRTAQVMPIVIVDDFVQINRSYSNIAALKFPRRG